MKKFCKLLTSVTFFVLMCSCADSKQLLSEQENYSNLTINEIIEQVEEVVSEKESTTVTTEPQAQKITPSAGKFIYDYANVLSEEDETELSSQAEYLYSKYLVNIAVVTTEHIGDYSPYTYAQYAYNQIYQGRGSGLLVLINNDTNEDYIYKTGSCEKFIDEDYEKLAFYLATKNIVENDYKSAVLNTIGLSSLCPSHVFDNTNVFTKEEVDELENILVSASNDIAILATSNTTDSTNEEICKSYCQRHYTEGEGSMIMIDTNLNSITVFSNTEPPSDFQKILNSANKLAEEKNYKEAVKKIIDAIEN